MIFNGIVNSRASRWRRGGILALLFSSVLSGQWWTVGEHLRDEIDHTSDGKLIIKLEFRSRFEDRTTSNFGRDIDHSVNLFRTRFGMTWQATEWLKFSGMLQDSRAPLYGGPAPNNIRDAVDLHESYMEIGGPAKRGFGLNVGRMMLDYGDSRLIGTPQWGNVSRTYDEARAWYKSGQARFEILVVSPVKVITDGFNYPVLGDKTWGTYNVFPEFGGGQRAEGYLLRHEQNKAGGFTGSGTLGITAYGTRWSGPLAKSCKYTLEGVIENGHAGPASQLAGGFVSTAVRKAGRLTLTGEYKYASGTADPTDKTHSGTFDQMYAANHDKFGHEDLFGWINMHNIRAQSSWTINPRLTLSFMYNSYWLASAKDSLYNGSGKPIATSPSGTAGRFVGQEADAFVTWKVTKAITLGAGYGYFANGEFLQHTTPGKSPHYAYVFETYSF